MTTFVDPNQAAQFNCVICLDVFKHPVQIGCQGHVFCKQCISQLIDSRHNITCPICRCHCNSDQITAIPFIQRQINSLQTKCPNFEITPEKAFYIQTQPINTQSSAKENTNNSNSNDTDHGLRRSKRIKEKKTENITGNITGKKRKRFDDEGDTTHNHCKKRKVMKEDELCAWTGAYSELNSHLKICPLQLTKCQYCAAKMLKRALPSHFGECPDYLVSCTMCNQRDIRRCELSDHQRLECIKAVIPCPQRCGQYIARDQVESHIRQCQESYVYCTFGRYGCHTKFKRKDEDKHYGNRIHKAHSQFVKRQMISLELRNNNLEKKIHALNNQLRNLRATQAQMNQRFQTQIGRIADILSAYTNYKGHVIE